MSNDIIENIASIQAQIADAAQEGGREASDVTLVAVSKTHDAPRIQQALDAGHRVFGENRVQEAEGKWPALKEATRDVSLHLIGPLQGNKVKPALELFDVIETVDRPKLARRLAGLMDETGLRPNIFIQVNTGEEPQKAGILPHDVDAFVAQCRDDLELPVIGLMCIPPADQEPGLHFGLLAEIAKRSGIVGLSMGMSGDFETAIRFGATHVRVGTAIFGPRAPFTPMPD